MLNRERIVDGSNAERKLFINFSKDKRDILIAEDIITHLRSTKAFKDQNIQDSGSFEAGAETAKILLQTLTEADAVIHLLSADFQTEDCSKVFDTCLEIRKRMFSILIRSFPYEYDKRLANIEDELMPDDKKDIVCFTDEAERDRIITIIITEILNRLGITEHRNQRGSSRLLYYGMVVGALLLGVILIYEIFRYTNDWLLTCIPLLSTIIIAGYLISALKHPFSITLYKAAKP